MTDSDAPSTSWPGTTSPGGAGSGRSVAFFVPGHPRPQGSKRAVAVGVVLEQSRHLQSWRARVSAFAAAAWDGDELLAGPVRVSATFAFARAKSHYHKSKRRAGQLREDAPAYPISKSHHGDLDKLLRALCDSLSGVVIVDDSLVVVSQQAKVFVPIGGPAGVHVIVQEV